MSNISPEELEVRIDLLESRNKTQDTVIGIMGWVYLSIVVVSIVARVTRSALESEG